MNTFFHFVVTIETPYTETQNKLMKKPCGVFVMVKFSGRRLQTDPVHKKWNTSLNVEVQVDFQDATYDTILLMLFFPVRACAICFIN